MDKAMIHHLKPTIWIGKRGCTEDIIDEIKRQIKDRKVIKVKWLRNTEINPESIAASANADLINVRGRTMVLAERTGGRQRGDSRNI